jgi:hypothetical protein
MHRALSLSAFSALALCAAGAASAQSRTVSTADMPKPGVSYISGPAVPVRRETVSTGSLPQPPHLYAGDRATVVDDGYDRDAPYNDGYGGYYSGNYGGGYGNGYDHDDRYDRDRDRNHGRPDHGNHGNGDRPPNTSNTVILPARGTRSSTTAPAFTTAPDRSRQDDRRGRDDRGNGWNNGNPGWSSGHDDVRPVQPGTGTTNSRAPQPGTGMGSGNQPGTGIPMRGGWNNGR